MIGARELVRADVRRGQPGRLAIALGTEFQVHVLDAREFGPWATPSATHITDTERLIVYHHTASRAVTYDRSRDQLASLQLLANASPYGLPYNFVVIPAPPWRIYYLNDVDMAWPHTLAHNGACAIAALGNYEEEPPPDVLPRRMMALADALATMWGQYVPEIQHRDVFPTACPGRHLSPLLRR